MERKNPRLLTRYVIQRVDAGPLATFAKASLMMKRTGQFIKTKYLHSFSTLGRFVRVVDTPLLKHGEPRV